MVLLAFIIPLHILIIFWPVTQLHQTCQIQKFTHWSSVLMLQSQRIDFKMSLLVYKSLNGSVPNYISGMLVPCKSFRTLRTSATGQLVIPRVRTEHGEAAFQFYAAKTWNNLPDDVRQALTLTILNSKLKTFLFYNACSTWIILHFFA